MSATYNYTNPATGATPPTAAQARPHQTINCSVTGDGTVTAFTVNHNWNLSVAERTAGFPMVFFKYANHADAVSGIFVASQDANSITFTCLATLGTVEVSILRYSQLQ